MEPEITLVAVSVIAAIIFKVRTGNFDPARSGRIGLSAMLCLTGVAHFVFAKGMSMMLPAWVPYKMELVYLTGILELLAAAGLSSGKYRKTAGWLLILFFILLTPANIYAAMMHLNEQTGMPDGPGIAYLWYRIPLQALFIAWTYASSIR